MSTLFFLLLAVLCFFWMAETKVTFSPFTFEMMKFHKAVGFFLIIIGIWFIEFQAAKTAVNEFKIDLIESLENSRVEIKDHKETTDGSK
jgi:hypothetical protein